MKKILLLVPLILILLTGCQPVEDDPADIPVYEFNYSPAVRPILPAIYACATEFPDVIFAPQENYYQGSGLSIRLGEPEIMSTFSIPLAYDEIVLITNPANPVTGWTDFRIINIMNGRIDNWNYLGWEGEVEIWLPGDDDEVRYLFNMHLLDDNPVSLLAFLANEHRNILDAVAGNPFAVGILPASFTDNSISVHSLNIRVPVLALYDTELDQVQTDFLLCLQGEIGQNELKGIYEVLP